MATKEKNRLELEDTGNTIIKKLGGGNPGALNVVIGMLKYGPVIDPQGLMGMGAVMMLDSLGIYESRIWLLYKDVCDSNLVKLYAVMRSFQLGYITEAKVNHAIENRGEGLDTDALLAAVRGYLDQFTREEVIIA